MKYYDTELGGSGGPPKPYFTKYLPVEGEIKEGDKVWDSNFNRVRNIKYVSKELADFSNKTGNKKAKLSLCSRDIQVGDRVYYTPSNKSLNPPKEGFYTVNFTNPPLVSFTDTRGVVDRDLCIKVIGEVSPEATWVKEGMEFDKEQIKVVGYGNHWDKHRNLTNIQFKCPHCGKFS